jgi:hypothetical protein
MSEQVEVLAGSCRRQQVERRQANLRSMFYALFMSRRQLQRRAGFPADYYSDRYDLYTFCAAIVMTLLCVFDAFLSLELIRYGSMELNPILAWALNKNALVFFILKYTITAMCMLVTVMHRQFRVFGVTGFQILLAFLVSYGVIVNYELSMMLPILF